MIERLSQVPGDTVLVKPGFDHSFSYLRDTSLTTARASLSEDHQNTLEANEVRITVFLIGG